MLTYDVIIVGGGHAGIEAALACARMKHKTLLLTGNIKMMGHMPCNPSIGGPAKGVVVREIDALGGAMAKAADATALQIKMLNLSRGPAVWALRAQSDKLAYAAYMQKVVLNQPNLTVQEKFVKHLSLANHVCTGVELTDGTLIKAHKTILTTGTFLEAMVLKGKARIASGPDNQKRSTGISEQLEACGLQLVRLKTGTPPRLLRSSIDFSKAQPEPGSNLPLAFSYSTKTFLPLAQQELCWLIYSNAKTHAAVYANLENSPMFSGEHVLGTGPRYCPSFEDKVVRFKTKPRHQIFLEPESKQLNTIYVQGFSTSMPEDVQAEMVHSLPGLEKAVICKYGYAIEYDAINPIQMHHTLANKNIMNLYTAGQINGTSGYEEAACQGLMAGINACLAIQKQPPFVLKRHEAYIGVLIDDLVTKGTKEPYRLLTSRAEWRLLIRNDNAEQRLKHYAFKFGLIDEKAWKEYQTDQTLFSELLAKIKTYHLKEVAKLNLWLESNKQALVQKGITAENLMKRPHLPLAVLAEHIPLLKNYSLPIQQGVLINVRFAGYIAKEKRLLAKASKWEQQALSANLDYAKVANLASEAKEKLQLIKPTTIGQASRIPGVTPADIQMLLFHLKQKA